MNLTQLAFGRQTPRLVLRPLLRDDCGAIHHMYGLVIPIGTTVTGANLKVASADTTCEHYLAKLSCWNRNANCCPAGTWPAR